MNKGKGIGLVIYLDPKLNRAVWEKARTAGIPMAEYCQNAVKEKVKRGEIK